MSLRVKIKRRKAMATPPWPDPPKNLKLSSADVHVWQAALNPPAALVQQLAQTLRPNERARAARFHFERDRRRFIVARGALRAILGRYLALAPEQVALSYGPQGKPFLTRQPENAPLQFNVAHSHELALLAFARSREIGVDLEHVHPMPDMEQIAARFFSVQENEALKKVPDNQKLDAFFNCWTRKEAYIKARGQGLSIPLDSFCVSLAPGRPAALLKVENNPQETARWTLTALQPAPGYVAALAVEGSNWHLARWRWSK